MYIFYYLLPFPLDPDLDVEDDLYDPPEWPDEYDGLEGDDEYDGLEGDDEYDGLGDDKYDDV
jgi:hypothetical protein